jgi:hypothetical protein
VLPLDLWLWLWPQPDQPDQPIPPCYVPRKDSAPRARTILYRAVAVLLPNGGKPPWRASLCGS